MSEIVGIWWRGNEQSKIVDRTAEKTLPVWIFWSESEIFDRSGNVRWYLLKNEKRIAKCSFVHQKRALTYIFVIRTTKRIAKCSFVQQKRAFVYRNKNENSSAETCVNVYLCIKNEKRIAKCSFVPAETFEKHFINLDIAVFVLTLLTEGWSCFPNRAVRLLLSVWDRGDLMKGEWTKQESDSGKTLPVWILIRFNRRSFSGNVR